MFNLILLVFCTLICLLLLLRAVLFTFMRGCKATHKHHRHRHLANTLYLSQQLIFTSHILVKWYYAKIILASHANTNSTNEYTQNKSCVCLAKMFVKCTKKISVFFSFFVDQIFHWKLTQHYKFVYVFSIIF